MRQTNCGICGELFYPHSSRSKYCSYKCKYAARNKRAREHVREQTNYYERRAMELIETGWIVISPKNILKNYNDQINKD